MSFKLYRQLDGMDCGPTCLRMVAKHYGRNFNLRTLSKLCEFSKDGVSLLGLSDASEKIGFRSVGVKFKLQQLNEIDLPCILHWRNYHLVVLYKIKAKKYYIADPSSGLLVIDEADFKLSWLNNGDVGIALVLSPSPAFYAQKDETDGVIKWSFIIHYLKSYRSQIFQLLLGLGLGSLLQLIVPFLTQSIVDVGINTRNLNFIYIILVAQFVLMFGRVSIDFIRSWILLHISTRVSVSILTDFLIKLMKLPMSFFDTKMTGDIMQRMNDQQNIENFLTGSVLTTVFSLFNLVVFSIVIAYYNTAIFIVFLISSILYIAWIVLFLKRRRILNYKSFEISSQNQGAIVQLVHGMQEIKLNNCEQSKRWEWEHIQAQLFKFNVKNLTLSQYLQGGSTFINECKNILITFISAKAVLTGTLSFGGMIAIQYIVGQLNSPIENLLTFIQAFQNAKISLERLNEIHQMEDERSAKKEWSTVLPEDKSIYLKNITFRYPGAGNEPVLKKITVSIPQGKTTAIVGMSGSGKTTLLKLLLRFYEPHNGEMKVGDESLENIDYKKWRSECGVVMQDGFIFSDSIEKNISVGDEFPDKKQLRHAITVANIQDFIDSLPLGLNTKIGAEGSGISQGQRQRILIARAVYKNPQYLFFDEATNALDANNERIIMNNLNEFFQGRTVVIVAHRLSTVSNADNIIVLDKGEIIEQGDHSELAALKGDYYNLVKNQLELGN